MLSTPPAFVLSQDQTLHDNLTLGAEAPGQTRLEEPELSKTRQNKLPRCCAVRLTGREAGLSATRAAQRGQNILAYQEGTRAHWRSPNDRGIGRSVPHSVQFSKTACPQAHRRTGGFGERDTRWHSLGGVAGSGTGQRRRTVNCPPDGRLCQRSSASLVIGVQPRADSGSAVEVYPATLGCQPAVSFA